MPFLQSGVQGHESWHNLKSGCLAPLLRSIPPLGQGIALFREQGPGIRPRTPDHRPLTSAPPTPDLRPCPIIRTMTFEHLLDGAQVLSRSGNPSVSGVEYDSRRVKPGCVFVAMRGETSDGNRYIDQAIQAGAVAVITDSSSEKPRQGVAWAVVPHGRQALARVSANFYKRPAERIAITGITGTNGKSTTA